MKKIVTTIMLMMFSTFLSASSLFTSGTIEYRKTTPVMIKNLSIKIDEETGLKTILEKEFCGKMLKTTQVNLRKVNGFSHAGTKMVKYQAYYNDIPVMDGFVTATVKNGSITELRNSIGTIDIDTRNFITKQEAVKSALFARNILSVTKMPKYHAAPFIMKMHGRYMPVFKVRFMPIAMNDNRVYYVHADSGKFLFKTNETLY